MTDDRFDKLDADQLEKLLLLGQEKTSDQAGIPPTSDLPQIEGYQIKEQLGEGGFGIVFLAEQTGPIRRSVALKVIKPGMDSKAVIARFEAERQTLALLEHPNIAHVFGAGTTQAGLPYFAMEYIEGVSITEYCDAHKLSIEDRLGLFLQVCEAIQHAHQKGIIHRDIKPSNILMTTQDDRVVPKVIDFGIAKALHRPLTERTLFTEQGQFVGTPEYMSPEQAGLTDQDIDTRSDIYSLGILLYELLTGVLPFERETLRKAALAEIQRIIQEEDPLRPSARLSGLQDEQGIKVAQNRDTEVPTLVRRLHRELEWIPLKAMFKDRSERYRTASELADDIKNYLSGNPLIAGPPSTIYHIKKYIRKHRAACIIAALVLAILINTSFISSYLYVSTKQAKERAERIADQATAEALSHRALARQFALDAFLQAWHKGEVWRARQIAGFIMTGNSSEKKAIRFLLDNGPIDEKVSSFRQEMAKRPHFAEFIIGECYIKNGDCEEAVKAYQRSHEALQQLPRENLSAVDRWLTTQVKARLGELTSDKTPPKDATVPKEKD